MSKNYCLISHTHWDREWYIPFENFRMKLVDLIDNLLDILDKDSEYRFHLDAQTIVLEDYLEIKPENRQKLQEYIRQERILVGPWYVQSDFHLTSGEATVRNLTEGIRLAKEFGKCTMVGYAADQFGIISQLPQIYAKFGLQEVIFGRGLAQDFSEFYWESEDGSKIIGEHMRFWYNNAQRLPEEPQTALDFIRQRGEQCAMYCVGSNYLLMNGVDHLEAQENLTQILEGIAPLLGEDEKVFQDTMPDFMNRLRKEIKEKGLALKTVRGELREGGKYNLLTNTLSSRVEIKQQNVQAQAALERELEPLYTILDQYGVKDYPKGYMRFLWKLLFQNHAHDSIYGCSVDDVNHRVLDRFERIRSNTTDLFSRAVDSLSTHMTKQGLGDRDYRVILFNNAQVADKESVLCTVDIPVDEDTGSFTLTTPQGKPVDFLVESIQPNVGKRMLSAINLPGEKRVNRYVIRFVPDTLPALGYTTLYLKPASGKLAPEPVHPADAHKMENGKLSVTIHPDGTVDMLDKRNGASFSSLLTLLDEADRGELYIFMAGDPNTRVLSSNADVKVEVLEENRFLQKRKISYTLQIDRPEGSGTIGVEMILSLDALSDKLDVEVTLDNQVTHHRVRVLIPTGIRTDKNYAGQPFDCVERPAVSPFQDDEDHPNTDYFGVEDGNRGLAVFNEGLYEYEQLTDDCNTLALTLLRSTGRIVDYFENEETMTEGWKAPEGFCLGQYKCRFALMPYSGSHSEAKVAARSVSFVAPVKAVCRPVDQNKFIGGRPFVQASGIPENFYRPIERAEKQVPEEMNFVSVTASVPDAMVVTAIKKAENSQGMIVRLFNSVSAPVDFTMHCDMIARKAELCNLNEEFVSLLELSPEGNVTLTAKPKEIITIRLR